MERVFGEDKALVHFLHSGKLPEAPAAGADSLFGDPVIPGFGLKRRNLKDKLARPAAIVSKDIGMDTHALLRLLLCERKQEDRAREPQAARSREPVPRRRAREDE